MEHASGLGQDRTPEKGTDNLKKRRKTDYSSYQEIETQEKEQKENLLKEKKKIYREKNEGRQTTMENKSLSKTTSTKNGNKSIEISKENYFPIFQSIPSSIFKFKAVNQAGKFQDGDSIKAKNKANSAVSHHHPHPQLSSPKKHPKSKTSSNKSKPRMLYLQSRKDALVPPPKTEFKMKPIHSYFKSEAPVKRESAPNQDKDFPPTPVQLSPS